MNGAGQDLSEWTAELMDRLAHEVRNPLAGILTLCEWMGTPGFSGPVTDEMAQVAQAANRVNRLVLDAAAAVRTVHRLGLSPPGALPVGPVLSGLAQIDPRLCIADDSGRAQVCAAPEFLGLALHHVVANARDFATPGTMILLSAARTGDQLILRCHNSGGRIAAGDLARLTEPFFRRRPPAGAMEHSGLGLTLASRIVSHYGGQMSITSDMRPPGAAGTTVTLALPRIR